MKWEKEIKKNVKAIIGGLNYKCMHFVELFWSSNEYKIKDK
jgi:hypothetical protein